MRVAPSRKMILFGIAFIAMFLSLHCNDNGVDGGQYFPTLTGTVTNVAGMPLSDVGVHYIFHFDTLSSSTTLEKTISIISKTLPTTTIGFSLPQDADVTLRVFRVGTRELIATVLNREHFTAGDYEVDFDAGNLTTGIYFYLLEYGSVVIEKYMALLLRDYSELVQTTPLTTSASNGKFALPIPVLGIGTQLKINSFDNPSLISVSISNRIDLVLYKNGYRTLVTPMYISVNSNMSASFKLELQPDTSP